MGRGARDLPTPASGQTRRSHTAATVVDLSYGGLRLRLRQPPAEPSHDVQPVALPAVELAVHARTVWTGPADRARSWWYGLELDEPDPETNRAWRAFVDVAS